MKTTTNWGWKAPSPPPRRRTVSACMIVKDEEPVLARCLRSLKGAVDQIVVVDTGSRDRTIEIARDHGALVRSFEWCDDFSAARNAALKLATGDWVLSIDADEWLPNDRVRSFIRAAANQAPPDVGFVPYTRLPAGGRQFTAVRLFARAGSYWEHRVHEQIVLPRKQIRNLRHEDFEFGHDGYTAEGHEAKVERNVPLLERQLAESAPGSRAWNHAAIYLARARPRPYSPADESAVEEAVMVAAHFDPMNGQLLTYRLYEHLIGTQRFTDLDRVNEAAMAAGAKGPLNYLARAIHLIEAGQIEEARAAFASAEAAQDDFYVRQKMAAFFESVRTMLGGT